MMAIESSEGGGEGDDTGGTSVEVVSPALLDIFMSHVAVRDIVTDAFNAQFEEDCKSLSSIIIREQRKPNTGNLTASIPMEISSESHPSVLQPTTQKRALPTKDIKNTVQVQKRSRAEIEAEARSKGASGG